MGALTFMALAAAGKSVVTRSSSDPLAEVPYFAGTANRCTAHPPCSQSDGHALRLCVSPSCLSRCQHHRCSCCS